MIKIIRNTVLVTLLSIILQGCNQEKKRVAMTDMQISETIQKYRPSKGATIPADIQDRLGTTHVGGKYWFGDEPYLIEGCKRVKSLGFNTIKLWFYKDTWEYPYNSEWGVTTDLSLAELAAHPYFRTCFEMPFSTIFLSTGSSNRCGEMNPDLAREEEEIYELSRYLLETYKNREITFIIQNWEGDWLLREDYSNWLEKGAPDDVEERLAYMKDFFTVRQQGVSRARKEFPGSKCDVLHAIEVNKVMDGMSSVPTLTTHVLPYVQTDLVSWSCYDGMADTTGISLYKGLEFIREHMVATSHRKGKKNVYIGEIGFRENMVSKEYVMDCWDRFFGVFLAQDVPYVTQWELYCNEPIDQNLRHNFEKRRNNEEMRGFWLIRPDGTRSHSMEYLGKLIEKAGI